MLPREGLEFGRAFFTAKGDVQVVQREAAVFASQHIRHGAQHPADVPHHDERQQPQHAFDAPEQRVNNPLHGACG